MLNRKKFTLDTLDSPNRVVRMRWNRDPLTILEILSQTELPLIAQVADTEEISHVDKTFDWSQPLLMYKQLSEVKVYARLINDFGSINGWEFAENPQITIIPADYQGWLEILGRTLEDEYGYTNSSDTNGSFQENYIELWDTLAKVIAAMPARFISVQALKAYVMISPDSDIPCYNKQNIAAFSEFQVIGIVEDIITFVKNNQTESKMMRCLECKMVDSKTNILIPSDITGRFFATQLKKTTRQRQPRGSVYPRAAKIRQVIAEEDLPIYVRVLSESSNDYSNVSGVLELLEVDTENAIIGCNVSSEGNTMFELPVTGGPLFYRALDNLTSSKNHHLRKAMVYVQENCEGFLRSIKTRSVLNNTPEFIQIVETPM